jgi:hypothetical protein
VKLVPDAETRDWLELFWELRDQVTPELQCPTPLTYEDGTQGRCVLHKFHTDYDWVPVDIPHADKDGRLAGLRVHRDTIRQVRHFGWLYPNGTDLRDPDVYGEQPCDCGCETTAADVREWRTSL